MAPDPALVALVHTLIFAYWLGGDLGVFYASFILADRKREPAARMAAAKLLGDLDLVPRACLLFALPTGLLLADAKGWIAVAPIAHAAAFGAAFLWAALVFRLHVRPHPFLTRLDLGLRVLFLLSLGAAGVAGLAGVIRAPDFLAIKLLLLAFCVGMGLMTRMTLRPFGPALARLASEGPHAEGDATIARSLSRARGFVLAIWAALVAAVYFGLATPT